MKTEMNGRFACTAALAAALTVLAGSSSTGHRKGEATAGGLQTAAERIVRARTAREATLAALNDRVEEFKTLGWAMSAVTPQPQK